MNDKLYLLKSLMIGHAVGDALGVPVEFCEREELDADPVTDMRGFGTYDVPAGAWSDDTSMSLATLDSLTSGNVDLFGIMVNFAQWLGQNEYTPTGETFDAGRTYSEAILDFINISYCKDHGFILPPGFDMSSCGKKEERSNGNGSLMRIHPVAFIAWCNRQVHAEWETVIEKVSALTHAHERSVLGCKIYTFVLFHLLNEPSKVSVKLALHMAECFFAHNPEYDHYQRLFEMNFADLPREQIKSSGYVVDTLEAALWCLLTTDSYKDCVLKAVNLGSDTDTVAAVAGGLAGVLYGYDAIPAEWRNTLIKREYIEEMCEKLCKNLAQ